MKIGYARVSTSGQTLDAQLDQLREHGCDLIFQETMSGARSDRPELRRALAALDEDYTFVVTRLDRLARSTFDLLETVRVIEGSGAKLKSLAKSWADMTTPAGRLILTEPPRVARRRFGLSPTPPRRVSPARRSSSLRPRPAGCFRSARGGDAR